MQHHPSPCIQSTAAPAEPSCIELARRPRQQKICRWNVRRTTRPPRRWYSCSRDWKSHFRYVALYSRGSRTFHDVWAVTASQELANLERFAKRQQQVVAPPGSNQSLERLLKEEAYIKSRLNFVQQATSRPEALPPADRGAPRPAMLRPAPICPNAPWQELAEARNRLPRADSHDDEGMSI